MAPLKIGKTQVRKTVEPDVEPGSDELLRFFKALADANRLKILGLLSRERLSVEQLAEILNLRPSTVSHHLARLSEVGLVSARPMSYYNLYQVEFQRLEELAQRLLSRDALLAAAAQLDLDAYDRKALADFSLPDGRLKTIPAQHKNTIREKNLRVYYIDMVQIARDVASEADLQMRMQGIVLLGAFLKLTPYAKTSNMTDAAVYAGVEKALRKYFGKRGEQVVEDNLNCVKRGFSEMQEIPREMMQGTNGRPRAVG